MMVTGLEGSARLPAWSRDAAGRADKDAHGAQLCEAFARCEHRLGRYLVQIIRDRGVAEDLLQDTFHDAFKAREQLAEVDDAEARLFGIAHNRALSSLRKRRRLHVAFGRLTAFAKTEVEAGHEIIAVRDLLGRHLGPEDRAMLLLYHLHGFSTREIAAMSGRSPEAVRQRLSRARAKLAAATRTPPHRKETCGNG